MNNNLFFLLAKPFIHHLNGAFLLILFFVLGYLFICCFWKDRLKKNRVFNKIIVVAAIIFGLYFRLSLAGFTLGNYDLFSYKIVAEIVSKGENVYAATKRYNYSPFWFMILSGFYKINTLFAEVSFRVIVRGFLSLVDLATLAVLYKISKLKKIFFPPVAVGFFLNPVSIIITGYHGQFENLTLLFILSGAYFYLRNKKSKLAGLLFLSAGIIKHIVFNQVLVFLNHFFKKKNKVIFAFALCAVIFLSAFIPFWPIGKRGIINNVFLYKSLTGGYGINYFLEKINPDFVSVYNKIFIFLLFIFAFKFKSRSLVKAVLVNSLFFLSFAPGMSDQYLILPIAVASLSGSLRFYLFTFIVSFYLFQSPAQLYLKQYSFISSNIVWLICLLWFIIEFFKPYENKS